MNKSLTGAVPFAAFVFAFASPTVALSTETETVVAEAAAALVEWKPDTNNGSADLALCKDREAILRFDVNGMANATAVKARFYCSAHLATTATPISLALKSDSSTFGNFARSSAIVSPRVRLMTASVLTR